MKLPTFFAKLDEHAQRVPLDELTTLMGQLKIDLDELSSCVLFSDTHYRRNLLHEGSGYQALLLCWKAGQRSPIHDHRGSSCGVRVLAGVATETTFTRAPDGTLTATRTRELITGEVCGSQDADIHQMCNLQADGSPLITLHVYSPPLLQMGTYSLTDGSVKVWKDPVHQEIEAEAMME